MGVKAKEKGSKKETKGKKGIYYKVVVANTKTIKGTANALELRLEAFLRY